MLVLLYLQCADALLHKKHVAHARKYALFAYSSFILVLATLAIGLAIRWGEMVFVDDRNYPGGPAIFYNAFDSYWVPIASNSCFVVLNLAANAMLVSIAFRLSQMDSIHFTYSRYIAILSFGSATGGVLSLPD